MFTAQQDGPSQSSGEGLDADGVRVRPGLWFWSGVLTLILLQELSEEIEDYTQRFNTEDQLEWNLVLQEVAAFIEVTSDPG